MPKVTLDRDHDHPVTPGYTSSTGPVLRSDHLELAMFHHKAGKSAKPHSHPEEQILFVLTGRLEVTANGQTYEVGPGEASFHPANEEHAVRNLEDSVSLSFKNLVAEHQYYEATGRLGDVI